MRDIITEEIDVRPAWRRWFTGRTPARRPRYREVSALARPKREGVPIVVVLAAGAACFIFGMIVSGGRDETTASSSAEVPAPQHATAEAVPRRELSPPVAPGGVPPVELPSAIGSASSAAAARGAAAAAVPEALSGGATAEQGNTQASDTAATLASTTALLRGASEIPPREDAVGTVHLETDPSVIVYDGDRRLGKTPLDVRMDEGVHELRFVDRARYLEEKAEITFVAGRKLSREIYFGIGGLRVLAPDGAKLFLDRRPAGVAPFESRIELSEGHHRLKLVLEDEVIEETIDVPAGQTLNFRVRP